MYVPASGETHEWEIARPFDAKAPFGVWRRTYRSPLRSSSEKEKEKEAGFQIIAVGETEKTTEEIDLLAMSFAFCSCAAKCGCGYSVLRNNCRTFVDHVLARMGLSARCRDYGLKEGSSSMPQLVLGWMERTAAVAAADLKRAKELEQEQQQAAEAKQAYSWAQVLGQAGKYFSTAVASSLQNRALVAAGLKPSQQHGRFVYRVGEDVLLKEMDPKTWLASQ